jgi:hypothetical protein
MYPPIFQICASDTSVLAVLGDGPRVRLYPFGHVPHDLKLEKRPYAVWQITYGTPENSLSNLPDTDYVGLQVFVYGDPENCREATDALTAALEPHAHVTGWDGEGHDADTDDYWVTFSVDWFVYR